MTMTESRQRRPGAFATEYPKALYIELTDRCNLLCPMCRQSAVKGNVLPLETFQRIADELFPHAVFVDLRGWGESTLIRNFTDYLDYALRFPLKKKLISNGTVKKPALWSKIGAAGVVVGFSIDAADEDLFQRLRVGARLDETLDNVRTFLGAAAGAGLDPRRQGYFCITVSGDNVRAVDDIIELGLSLGIDRFKLEPIKTSPSDPSCLDHHRQASEEAIERMRALARRTGARIELSASLTPASVDRAAVDKLCIHPWEYLYVNARGRLGFCDHLNGLEQFTFGEWGNGTFESFWNGEKMRLLRQEHLNRFSWREPISVCGDCNWCYERRYADLEDWIDPAWSAYQVRL